MIGKPLDLTDPQIPQFDTFHTPTPHMFSWESGAYPQNPQFNTNPQSYPDPYAGGPYQQSGPYQHGGGHDAGYNAW